MFNIKKIPAKKPFLRWTGGKKWLTPTLLEFVRNVEFNNYYEPFLGGGSVFFSLGLKQKTFLSDSNSNLINTYIQVKKNPKKVIDFLKGFAQNKEFYYLIRNKTFKSAIKRAAQFIYLNKTSFNGIYRVNTEGKYNVPYGKRGYDINIIEQRIMSCSEQLQNTELTSSDFFEALVNVKKNDLVYLDPPYTITHSKNGFIEYNEKLFSVSDQTRLSGMIEKIRDKGAYYILSNAHHPRVREIYDKFGDKTLTLNRPSVISATSGGRGVYKEYLFTNIKT